MAGLGTLGGTAVLVRKKRLISGLRRQERNPAPETLSANQRRTDGGGP